jgi:hypothetical protein
MEYNPFGLLLKIPPKGGTTNALLKIANNLGYGLMKRTT